jgi:hypothetical protein
MTDSERQPFGGEGFEEDETTRYIEDVTATMGDWESMRSAFLSIGNTLFSQRTRYPEFDEYVDLPPTNFIAPPDGPVILPYERIIWSTRLVPQGRGVDRTQRELTLDKHGLAIVTMDRSGRLALGPGEDGFVATASLAGCTGVAGFARRADGSMLQFTSHYGPRPGESPINAHLHDFQRAVQESGELAGPAYCVIAYPEDEESRYESCAGKPFSQWRYTEQFKLTAGRIGADVRVLVLPYMVLSGAGHSLAAGREGRCEGIFWDGAWVNPEDVIR